MKESFDKTLIDRLESPERKRELPAASLLERLQVSGEVDVLDIGAGTGYFSIPAAALTTGTVYALDTEPTMLQMMRDRVREQGLTNVNVMEGIVEKLPFQEGTMDRVIASLILHITDELEESIQQIARVLRPGGRCLCLEWQEDPSEQRVPRPNRIDPYVMKDLLEQAGLKVENIEYPTERHYLMVASKQPV
ncbi:class I SAM-dependent methyltransferase [Paenibacillus glucanolyticus]|jgi:ubiquinone/menaquinone biosynthesis C-methylase UbiE|uniref:class I SAM-dependent methyltransferase n=1 Tax=Paenibacillus TaxID=44249 RepID=UPI0003E201CF|nr:MULTISPECIES: class I SAM-dependent methyltransferase [Paenibacillus]ANA79545.1 methyltransferase type 11 [Paenibacillus glucanolyticus]AVV56503.1 class I SAM-dependent methyltransferase [Paenibacillus glucanolyticus]ETT31219.1 type 11 methyltransferase [Paenibacillus sp. FSL R5-808]OMF77137.1 methyltransferase type 11 [Paenibacillus glucanolyticus]